MFGETTPDDSVTFSREAIRLPIQIEGKHPVGAAV